MMSLKMVVVLALVTATVGVCAMSISEIGRVCLFSAMSGVVTVDGKPAANLRLVRTAAFGSIKTDETRTDQLGRFEFPPVYERTVAKFLPQEFVVKQDIVADYNHEPIKIWDGVKRKPEENAEARGKPLVVECELLMEELAYKNIDGSPIFSRCKWDVESDAPYQGPLFDSDIAD